MGLVLDIWYNIIPFLHLKELFTAAFTCTAIMGMSKAHIIGKDIIIDQNYLKKIKLMGHFKQLTVSRCLTTSIYLQLRNIDFIHIKEPVNGRISSEWYSSPENYTSFRLIAHLMLKDRNIKLKSIIFDDNGLVTFGEILDDENLVLIARRYKFYSCDMYHSYKILDHITDKK